MGADFPTLWYSMYSSDASEAVVRSIASRCVRVSGEDCDRIASIACHKVMHAVMVSDWSGFSSETCDMALSSVAMA